MEENYKKEACVESLAEALDAERKGADQIELCRSLYLDGLTPSASVIQKCLSQLTIPIKVMVRPRSGRFVCDVLDLGKMITDIKMMNNLGVQHIVLGVNTADGEVDIESLNLLKTHAGKMKITFHKAIDMCKDPVKETERLIDAKGIHSILTSGGATSASEGALTLKEMSKVSKGRIQIIPAGSITDLTVNSLHKELQLTLYHGRKIVGTLNQSK